MSEHIGVWVFSENYNLMLELLAGGSMLATNRKTELAVVLLGSGVESKADELIKHGADKVFVVDSSRLKDFQIETYLSALTNLVTGNKPEILLIGSTKNGKELASRLAARLETGCTPDCSQLAINEEGQLVTKRIVYSGNAVVTATYRKKPQIATVPPRTFEKLEPKERSGEIVKAEVEVEESKIEVVGVNRMEVADVKIEDARIVVCGGRGIEKKEDFKPLEELAKLLGGQVGNTRPLAEDRKWFTGWVGLSGKKIKPTLYVGCGISGMIQHVAGMRDSQVVVAVNRDPEAAIFEVADYVIVGDLYEIVPAIVKELKKTLG
ncbi:MAG: electron transfer flavoprotein subunit alpha/FixB family protein [Candidatus Bathyarchaeota archaeon]|nr:electron transfer flavoprotein subunit alpha/FixB family protein [Candidatus Bathyarchaeota archaeon]